MRKTTLTACTFALGATLLFAQEGPRAPVLPLTKDPVAGLEKLPKGEAIMDKAVEATGGVKANKEIKSLVIKGTFDIPAIGMNAPITIYKASPNLMLTEMDMPGLGKVLEGCNGSNVWGYSAMTGPFLKTGRAAEDALDEARLNDYDWRANYASAETKGVEKVEDEVCYKVELTRRAGGGKLTLVTGTGKTELTERSRSPHVQYFSQKTGLLVKMEAETETEMGKLQISAVVKDYRKVGNVLMPFKMTNTTAGQTMTMTYTEIKVNTDIPRSKFAPPKEVMALIEKEAAKEKGGQDPH
jgi:outer membrane lipoprotein-sorting protein